MSNADPTGVAAHQFSVERVAQAIWSKQFDETLRRGTIEHALACEMAIAAIAAIAEEMQSLTDRDGEG